MAPFFCNGTRTILNNQVPGSQSTYLEMNNGVSKIDEESRENVYPSSLSNLSNKKDELCGDILLWLRTAALDPCKQKPPLEKLRRRQILKAREHISLDTTEFPWKKRKLDLLQKKSCISPTLAKPNEHSSFASSVSCLINSTDSTERSQKCLCEPSISVESLRYRNDLTRKRVRNSQFYESDDSISVASTPKKPNFQNIVNQPVKESNNLQLKQVCMPQAKITNKNFSPLSDSDDSVDNSSTPNENSEEKHKTACRSPRLQNFIASTPKKPNFQNIVNQPVKESNNLQLKQVCMPQAKITNKNFSPLSDSDDSVDNSSTSNENSEEKHKTACRSPRLQNFIASTPKKPSFQNIVNQPVKESNNLQLKQVCVPQCKITNKKFSPLSDSDDSVDNSSTSNENSEEKYKTARRSPRLQNFIGDSLPRFEVPVGTRHQADIPDWIGPKKSDNSSSDGQSDSFDSKYMGTKIWPIEGKNTGDSKEEGIGKGRSDSCSCYLKGCGSCIKLHVFKKGIQLREDLGTAFFTWKFDEMGEEVAKSWTSTEQQCFLNLVKRDRISQTDSFLEPALKQFSGKCKKGILSYYLNVFILRRMSKQTRLATKLVNSDDDDVLGTESSIKRKNTKYMSGSL